MNTTIDKFEGQYRFLSNFAPSNVAGVFESDGLIYPTVEHAYQAAKTYDAEWRARICDADTPGQAKRLGRLTPLREDWEAVKLTIMAALLAQKFAVEPFRTFLLATGTSELIEGNMWGDTYWGMCDERGENHLGRLLMRVRGLYAVPRL